jgi:hypothetical protein
MYLPSRSIKQSAKPGAPATEPNLDAIRSHMAESIVGSTVDLLEDSHHILHGVVTGVFSEAGKPKIVVAGHRYDLNQIITVLPATLN